MELEKKVKKLRKFSKNLSKIHFKVSQRKNFGEAVIKLREKFVVVECPDKNTADELCEKLNYAMNIYTGRIKEIIEILDKHAEQLTCFTRDNQPIPQGEAENGTPQRNQGDYSQG